MDLQAASPSPPVGEPKFVYPRATAGKRFLNYIIDLIAFYAIAIGISYVLGYVVFYFESTAGFIETIYTFLFYGIMVGYYFVMEHFLGRTLGKILTNTLVLNLDDRKPSWKQVLGRSFCRFIPFEAFSFLGGTASGWHDTIPKTKVVDTKRPPTVVHDQVAPSIPTSQSNTLPERREEGAAQD